MFDPQLLLSPSFWFSVRWNPLQSKTAILMAAVFALLVVGGAALLVAAGRIRKRDPFLSRAERRIAAPLVVFGLLGALFTFFAYQQIPIFSARFWFLILLLGFLVWEIFAIRFLLVRVPQMHARETMRRQFEQYLPRKKK